MVLRLLVAIASGVFFVIGSMFMQVPPGFPVWVAWVAVIGGFGGGVLLNVLLLHLGESVGVAYLVITVFELLLAVGLASWLHGEPFTIWRVASVVLVVAAVVVLAFEPGDSQVEGSGLREPVAQLDPARQAQLRVDALHVRIDRAA
jgi:drug/metabolite transporter (DMT)-like permease